MAESVLLKNLKFNPLEDGPVADDIAPSRWNGFHVGKRITEGFQTLALVPMASISQKSGIWPAYAYDWEDLLAQTESEEDHKERPRKDSPTIEQITRMERVLCWPAQYCFLHPTLMLAVNAVARAHAIGRDAGYAAKRYGGYLDTWQHNYLKGCERISRGLVRDKVAVF